MDAVFGVEGGVLDGDYEGDVFFGCEGELEGHFECGLRYST